MCVCVGSRSRVPLLVLVVDQRVWNKVEAENAFTVQVEEKTGAI